MSTFGSCHLIINRGLTMIVGVFVTLYCRTRFDSEGLTAAKKATKNNRCGLNSL